MTDGTLAGTKLLTQLVPNGTAPSYSKGFASSGHGFALFSADDGLTGAELWRTDASAGNTLQVTDIRPGAAGGKPEHIELIDELYYFDADDGSNGRELWLSDGTTTGTRMIADAVPGPTGFTFDRCASKLRFNGFVYFGVRLGAQAELWRTDGTAAATSRFHQGSVPASDACPLAVVGSTMYFMADNALWRTDGSAEGSQRIENSTGILPDALEYGGELVYGSRGSQPGSGRTSLWSLGSGTPRLLLDLYDPTLAQQPMIMWIAKLQNALYFGVHGRGTDRGGIYKWTGGSDSPQHVAGGIEALSLGGVRRLGSRLVFQGFSPSTGAEMFATDGTATGTVAITDVSAPGAYSIADDMLQLGPALYFQHSGQLARTNGTLQSSETLTDFVTIGPPLAIGAAAGQIILGADDARNAVENELYVLSNAAPTATPDSATVTSGQTIAIDVGSNDTDPDGEVIKWGARVTSAPAHGDVSFDADGRAIYRANSGFTGTDSFQYVAADNGGRESAAATVTVTVQSAQNPTPTPPVRQRGGGGSAGWLLVLALASLTMVQRNRVGKMH